VRSRSLPPTDSVLEKCVTVQTFEVRGVNSAARDCPIRMSEALVLATLVLAVIKHS